MTRIKYADLDCSVARALQAIGEHWALLIVENAFYGTSRFSDFQRVLGVARNILTSRLNHLVAAGILERYVAREGGIRRHYRLTQKGRDLLPVVMALMQWGDRWAGSGDEPPVKVFNRSTGEPIAPVWVTDARGNPLSPADLAFLAKAPGASGAAARP